MGLIEKVRIELNRGGFAKLKAERSQERRV